MKTVSTQYSTEEAREVAAALEGKHIRCEIRKVTEESGIDSFEVLVADEVYDQACSAVEEEERKERLESCQFPCPKCSSPDLEQVEDPFYVETEVGAFRCKKCGCVFAVVDGKYIVDDEFDREAGRDR